MSSSDTNSSLSDYDYEPWFYDSNWNWYLKNIFVWLFPLICLQGAIANACSFYVIVSNRKSFPYVTRQYLTIITLSDFLILTCKASTQYFTFMTDYVQTNAWTWYRTPRNWSFAWCIVYDFITYYAIDGAPFWQLGLTVDRLVAVAAPLKAKLILTHRRSWILLAVITAMALFLPTLFVTNRQWDDGRKTCGLLNEEFHANVYLPTELYFGRVILISSLILGTIAICLLLAWNNRAAQRMQRETASANQQLQQSNQERQRSLVRISLMLVFINVIFLLTCLPWSIFNISDAYFSALLGDSNYTRVLRHCNYLVYVNNAVNWPVYFMGGKFASAFRRIFLPRCPLRTAGSNGSSSGAAQRYLH